MITATLLGSLWKKYQVSLASFMFFPFKAKDSQFYDDIPITKQWKHVKSHMFDAVSPWRSVMVEPSSHLNHKIT